MFIHMTMAYVTHCPQCKRMMEKHSTICWITTVNVCICTGCEHNLRGVYDISVRTEEEFNKMHDKVLNLFPKTYGEISKELDIPVLTARLFSKSYTEYQEILLTKTYRLMAKRRK